MKPNKWPMLSLVCSLLALCVACTSMVIALLPRPAAEPQASPLPYTLEWFRTEAEPQQGQPHVSITCAPSPVYAIATADFPGGLGWMYQFSFRESSGMPFTVDSITLYSFDSTGAVFPNAYTADQVAGWWGGSSVIPAGGVCTMGSGMPVQDLTHQGISVMGRSPSGQVMEFHTLVEFIPTTKPQ
ncbi:MAG: hypothetical protein J6K13_09830 [Clostridia bacterium]|nr:hypothetical protein [Clostridia bacterium]